MTRYARKPLTVQAWQAAPKPPPDWLVNDKRLLFDFGGFRIATGDSARRVPYGHWVVQEHGELVVMRPTVFVENYERIDE